MNLKFYPYTLQFNHPFIIAHGMRTSTPVVFVEIEQDGIIGYGEASMPPYLEEDQATATFFLTKATDVIKNHKDVFNIESLVNDIDSIAKNNCAAKAAIDIALHDLVGKMKGVPCYKMFGLNKEQAPATSYTIGIDKPERIIEKVKEAEQYTILKVKLGSGHDKEIIDSVRCVTDKPVSVDVNQGWKNKEYALEMINWMSDKNILFIEQPLSKNNIDDTAWLTERSPLPIIADESVQRYNDIDQLKGAYSGINIKLMKCTGMYEAHKMMLHAKKLGMKVLIGCMSETSCAVSAAAHLSPLCDWADLDGPLLIKNNCFEGVRMDGGKIQLNDFPGIGIEKSKHNL